MVFQIKGDLFCRFLLYVRRRGKLSESRIDGPLSLFLLQTAEKMMLIWELFSAAPESQATRRWNNLISSLGARHSGITDSDIANSPIFRPIFFECFRLISINYPSTTVLPSLGHFFYFWVGFSSPVDKFISVIWHAYFNLFIEIPIFNMSTSVHTCGIIKRRIGCALFSEHPKNICSRIFPDMKMFIHI